MMSVFMMIGALNSLPFAQRSVSRQEAFDEIVIIVTCYHIILMTDFVPIKNLEFREVVSYNLVAFLAIVIVVYISQIIIPLF
jgi:hypothetical protein